MAGRARAFTNGPYTIKFSLSTSHTTSCGIYASNGQLVRTLWGGQFLAAGSYTRTWDGNDDFGNPMGPDTYTAKILSNNVTALWDGTIGNSSTYHTGPSHLGGYANVADILSVGNEVYILRTYNELGEYVDKFDKGAPGVFTPSGNLGLTLPAYQPQAFSTDGTYMYVCSQPVPMYTGNPNYIIQAYNLDEVSGALTFSNVPPIAGTGAGQNNSGQWIVLGSSARPTSIAVQKVGTALAVAQNSSGLIQLFDKRGGQPFVAGAASFNVPGVQAIRWSPDERTLWAATGNDVQGWQFTGSNWAKMATIPGTNPVKSFGVNPADGSLAILYGGTDQQLRAYTPQGTWLYSIGSRGGYHSGPAVNDTKFMIPPDFYNGELMGGGIGFQNDGKVWVMDYGNSRLLRFPVQRHLATARKDAMVSMVTGYMCTVDKNNPTRIFVGYQEFQRNYSFPLSAGPGVAWTLVNNWGFGIWNRNSAASTVDGFTNVVTASNGLTYAIMQPADTAPWNARLVELAPTGVRDIQVFGRYLESDMSAWTWTGNGTPRATISYMPLVSFQSNNPVYGIQTPYCSMPLGAGLPAYTGGYAVNGGIPFDRLPDGSIPTFNTGVGATDYNTYHLGFVKPGGTDWWVKTARSSMSTPLQHDGTVPIGGVPNSLIIPDLGGRTLGNIVAVFCNGEFFDSAESNQILLYDGSGLPITDFGTRLTTVYNQASPSGKAGNFYGNAFVMGPDGNPRIFTSDEAAHAGIHEWSLLNTASIQLSTAVFDGTNTANFGPIGLAIKSATPIPGQPQVTAMTSPIVISDSFSRPDSTTIGNGWQDPNASFHLSGSRLKVNINEYNADNGAILVRPESNTESDQTVGIPAQLFDQTKMYWSPAPSLSGRWGVFSRLQPDGSRYFAELNYVCFSGGGAPATQNGIFDVLLGMIVGGKRYVLGYDHGFFLPPSPGHSYSLELQTTGMGPTQLHCVIVDTTTGARYSVLDQVSDEPELQNIGLVGVQAALSNNEFTSYNATLSTVSYHRANKFLP